MRLIGNLKDQVEKANSQEEGAKGDHRSRDGADG